MSFVERGQAMVTRGQYQEAVKTCRLGLLAAPTNVEGRLVLGKALVALRRYDEVLAEMRVALEVDPANADALALRGEALLRKGDALQASDVLHQASVLSPGSAPIANLLQEADIASAAAGGGFGSFDNASDSMTKHYPAHRGFGSATPDSKSVTKPNDATAVGGTPAPSDLAIGDRSGTIELDPDLDGVEMVTDDDIGPAIGPPIQAADSATELAVGEESDVMELSAVDILPDSRAGRLPAGSPMAGAQQSAADDPTAAYRRGRLDDYHDEAPTVARDSFATGVGTAPESPRSKPMPALERGDPSALVRSAQAIDELFPEDESGVSKLEIIDPAPARLAPAVLVGDDDGPPRARSEDMRVIRAGLVLDAVTSGNRTRPPVRRPDKASLPRPSGARSKVDDERHDETDYVRGLKGTPRPARRKPAEVDRTIGVRRSRKRSPMIYVYLFLALAVGAGSVVLGLMWCNQRRQQQIGEAERAAERVVRKDTYDAYLEAARIEHEIQRIDDSPETRAAAARADAALAAEFGDGRDKVGQLVSGLARSNLADALAARAYAAIAEADVEGATRAAEDLAAKHGKDPMAAYLRGRAALLADKPDAAADAFRAALEVNPRPMVFVGLGLAEEARGKPHEAIAAFDRALGLVPGHPAATIHRARVAARSGQVDDPAALVATLEQLAAGQVKGMSVSPEERAWAALSLSEIELAAGKVADAGKALEQAVANRPPASWPFTEALIRGLVRLGRTDDARAEVERARKEFPHRSEPVVFLARLALERRDAVGAMKTLADAGDISKNAEALAVRGRAHLALDQVEDATKDLDAALKLDPDLREAKVARARVYLRTGEAKVAADMLEPLYQPDSPVDLSLAYAAALRQTDRKLDARYVLRRLEKRPDAGSRVFLELARLERAEGDVRSAREYYTKAIQSAPKDIQPRLEAAILALDTGDRAGAREAMEQLVKDAPDDGEVLLEAARVMAMSGAPDKAAELVARADKNPSAPRWKVARERGRVLIKQAQYDAAVSALENAVSLEPADGESRLLLIDAHLYREDEPAARAVLRGILKAFPNGAEAHLAKGRLDLYKDRVGEALASFKKARKVLEAERASPRRLADAAQWLGRVYYWDEKFAAARRSLEEAVGLDPSDPDAYYFLGLVELDSHHNNSAMNAFQKAVDIDPMSNPEAWFYLGESSFLSKKRKTSRKAFDRYLEMRPKGDLADDARKRLRQM